MHFTLQLGCVLTTELKFVKFEILVYQASEILATLMLCRISEGISEGCRLSDPSVSRMKVIGTTNGKLCIYQVPRFRDSGGK